MAALPGLRPAAYRAGDCRTVEARRHAASARPKYCKSAAMRARPARRWQSGSGTIREVVVAMADDPEAVILGSSLAAGLGVPILFCERDEAGTAISAAIQDLSVARILVAVSDARKSPSWIQKLGIAAEILPPKSLQHRLIAALGADKVRNVVVVRAPDDRADVGHTAWLDPI